MDYHRKLSGVLRERAAVGEDHILEKAIAYARSVAAVECAMAVVSDIGRNRSHIFTGEFGKSLGLEGYDYEDSIWEEGILSLMSDEEVEEKIITELQFFHFIRHTPPHLREHFHLLSKLTFLTPDGRRQEVMHRMYYRFDATREHLVLAICVYSPMAVDFAAKGYAVDSRTGIKEDLSASSDGILSRRERQVLSMVDRGMTSHEIAEALHISKNTVSRHRQEILAKLQVKNSPQAIRLAKLMGII